ncbi:MAG: DUF5103 domain-containing protein, partial [Bacteroidia bacterium]|nr:DUF5103 domain-containing protein [Bacteroidia bacterium]
MTKNLKHFLILSLIGISVFGQVVNETNPPDYIKSITIKGNTPESQLPIIRLGEDIVLEFDALNGNEDDFYYKI